MIRIIAFTGTKRTFGDSNLAHPEEIGLEKPVSTEKLGQELIHLPVFSFDPRRNLFYETLGPSAVCAVFPECLPLQHHIPPNRFDTVNDALILSCINKFTFFGEEPNWDNACDHKNCRFGDSPVRTGNPQSTSSLNTYHVLCINYLL